MGNQTDYFNRIGYKSTYDIGDRVFGFYKKIPFIGTVGNDRLINHTDGPEVTIHLDLPMVIDKYTYSFIIVKHKDIKQKLKDYDAPLSHKVREADSKPAGEEFDSPTAHQKTKRKK